MRIFLSKHEQWAFRGSQLTEITELGMGWRERWLAACAVCIPLSSNGSRKYNNATVPCNKSSYLYVLELFAGQACGSAVG